MNAISGESPFRDDDFAPADIVWNHLVGLDLHDSPEAQLDTACEDVFLAKYPNGCRFDIGWHGRDRGFLVTVNQDFSEWNPFVRRSCKEFAELRDVALELAAIARSRPSIRRPLIDFWGTDLEYAELNRLVLDPLAPLDTQIDALHRDLFLAQHLSDLWLKIGWTKPYAIGGEFEVELFCLSNDDRWHEAALLPLDEQLAKRKSLHQERCATIDEMLRTARRYVGLIYESYRS